MPRLRSCAGAAWSGVISMSLKVNCDSRPRLAVGLAATEGWKPVSISTEPTPGCSTRKAGTGTRNQSAFGTPSPNACRQAIRPSSRRNHARGPIIVPVRSGWSLTRASSRPPGRGSSAGRGSAAVAICGDLNPLPPRDLVSLGVDARVEREPRAGRHARGHAGADLLVLGQLAPVRLDLGVREVARVGAEEELQQGGGAQLEDLVGRLGAPPLERLAARVGDRVELAPAPALLALLGQVATLRQALGLAVELRVLERPEVPDRL